MVSPFLKKFIDDPVSSKFLLNLTKFLLSFNEFPRFIEKKKKNKDHFSLFFFSFSFDQAFENALHYLIMQT